MDPTSEIPTSESTTRSVLLDRTFQNLKSLDQMINVIEEQEEALLEYTESCDFPFRDIILQDLELDQRERLEDVRTSLRGMFDTLARPMIRPLRITDLPDEILVQIFEQVRGWEEDDMDSMVIGDKVFVGTEGDEDNAGSHEYLYDMKAEEFRDGIRNIEHIRLTCQKFCEISSHLLIPSLYVEMQPQSVARLEAISQHPTIGPGVRTVRALLHYYDARQAGDIGFFGLHGYAMVETMLAGLRYMTPENMSEEHRQTLLNAGEAAAQAFDSIFSREESSEEVEVEGDEQKRRHQSLLRRAHEEYRSRFEAQEALRRGGNFSRRVAAAMARMPVARRLEFHDIRYCAGESFQIERVEDDDHVFQMLLRPAEWFREKPHDTSGPPIEIMTELPIYLHRAGIQLATLTIDIQMNRYTSLMDGDIDTTELSAAMQGLKLFKYRPKLDRMWFDNDPADFQPLLLFLHSVLDTASIRRICLEHHAVFPRILAAFDLGPVMVFRQWPNLEALSLRRTAFHLKDLESLLRRHSPALQALRLDRVYLLSGTWAEVLDLMRTAGLRFLGVWYPSDPEGKALCTDSNVFAPDEATEMSPANRYICGYTDENPIRLAGETETIVA